jgi:hypothetical protein
VKKAPLPLWPHSDFPWERVESVVFSGDKVVISFKSGATLEAEGSEDKMQKLQAECIKNLGENKVSVIL